MKGFDNWLPKVSKKNLKQALQNGRIEISEPFMAFSGGLILDFGRDAFGDRIDRPRQGC